MIVRASGQLKVNPNHSIGTLSGKYHFSYEQTPEQLVEVSAPGFPNTGFTYQWQSSLTPVGVFTPIPGATQSSYSPPQLEQTTYFQRVSTNESAGVTVISNVVKISVVSVNWEDKNYIREHDVTVSGITTWKQVDKLPIGQKFQTTSYLDGSGRSIQKVSRETATPAAGSSVWGDMVQFSEYDVYGREVKKRLPYTTTTQSGKFKSSPGSRY